MEITESIANQTENEISLVSCSENKTILIIEGDPKQRYLQIYNFEEQFRVLWAENALDALDLIREKEVEALILRASTSTPKEFLVSTLLRNQVVFNDIYIVIIAPQQFSSMQADFYNAGIDACLFEPIESKVLKACLDNLYRKKKYKLNADRLYKEQSIQISSNDYISTHEEFLRTVTAYVESRLNKTKATDIADAMFISHSTLYRKIKYLTGMHVNEFIRNIRLRHAAGLIVTTPDKITDIAIFVGIKNPRYFGKMFKQLYGVSPSDYREKKST